MTWTPYSNISASMARSDSPVWATATGLPTRHTALAALHVATVIDRRGSQVIDARESYWHHTTGGVFPPIDLQRGERLLVDCGLLLEEDGTLHPSPMLSTLLDGTVDDAVAALCSRAYDCASSPTDHVGTSPNSLDVTLTELIFDPIRREELLLQLSNRWDDSYQRLVGHIAEELVVSALRTELAELGYPDLARAVRRVSLESDQLGYDVSAPRVLGPLRLIEVKGTTRAIESTATFHLSRNEADVGVQYSNWALVVCHVTDVSRREGLIVGWCPGRDLVKFLPEDQPGGRWEQVKLTLPTEILIDSLPRPML
jgi:hypothetical protein